MGDQEDILRRKQLSTTSFYNLSNIWIKKNRTREHVRLKLNKTIVKPVLMYNSQTWGLTVNDEHNPESAYRQQLGTAIHIKFPHLMSFPTVTSTSELMKSVWLWQHWKTDGNYLVTCLAYIRRHQLSSWWSIISHHLKIAVLKVGCV